MRAVEATRFGGPEVLVPTELPDPVAGRGQVVVEVAFAALDFVQTQLRQGFSPGPPLPEPPYIPGGSVSGVVRSIGPDVHESWSGARVVAQTSTHLGSNAEQVLAPADALISVPTELGLAQAAALMDDGSTALGLVDVVPPRSDEWVLVEAAAGGVGGLLVQLVKAVGARSITRIRIGPPTSGTSPGRRSSRWSSTVSAGLPEGRRERTERAFSSAVAETLTPYIGRTFPLEKAGDAHAAVETRAVLGKTLLSTS